MITTFIPQLLEIAKVTGLPIDDVFLIAYDYGFVDSFANLSEEIFTDMRGSGIGHFSNMQNGDVSKDYNNSINKFLADD